MERTYIANQEKANERGYDSNYTQIGVDNGVATFCLVGNHYAGCSCRLDKRPESCTYEMARRCIDTVISLLDDKDKIEIGDVVLKK